MATWLGKVEASSDDARQNSSTVGLTAATINTSGANQRLGFRFQNVTVPQGATISYGGLGLYLPTETADSPNGATIYGHDTDDAPTFTTANNNISDRTLTTAGIAIDAGTNIGTGWLYCDVIDIIQEIIDRGGWESGNALALIVRGVTGTDMTVQAYDGDPNYAASLYITYTVTAQEGTVSEGVEAGETLARGKLVSGSVAESANVIDPHSHYAQYPQLLTAAAALGETAAPRVDAQAVALDAAALADALSRGLLLAGTAADGVEIGDAPAFLYRITRAVSEGAAMGDTRAALGAFHVTRLDGAALAESMTGSLSSDTVEVTAAAGAWENPDGTVTLSGSSANVYADQPYLALLFANAPIPSGSTIVEAFLRLNVYTYDDPALTIYAEDSLSPAALTSGFENTDISERTPTTASVAWDAVNVGTGAGIDSPDIAAVIQEIHDTAGWVGGVSDILLILEDDGSGGFIRFYSGYHPDTSLRPKLVIGYSTSAVLVAGEVGEGLTAGDVATYDFLASLAIAEAVTASETLARIMQTARASSDGLSAADAVIIGRLVGLSAADGLAGSDAAESIFAVYGDAADGITGGDVVAARVDALAAIASGSILGATLAKAAVIGVSRGEYIMPFDALLQYLTARPVLAEGVAASSGIVGTITLPAAVIEGADIGAALLGIATAHAAIGDGLTAADALASELLAYLQASVGDGVRGGDNRTAAALRVAALADAILPADGFAGVLTALRALSDGATPADSGAGATTSPQTVGDGAAAGDAASGSQSTAQGVTEGAALGDATLRGILAALEVAESATAADGTGGGAVFYVQTADGMAMTDALVRVLQTAAAISDGFQAGSLAVRFTARGEITVTFQTRVGAITAVVR